MPRKVDPLIIKILEKYDIDPKGALWDCHGTWVMYHRACEQIAQKAGVTFDPPVILEGNSRDKIVAIMVVGQMGDHREWSFGEAAPSNNKNAYVYAMAEKRAKDRVILKLVGLHGMVYSEEEAEFEDDKKPAEKTPAEATREAKEKDESGELPPMTANNRKRMNNILDFVRSKYDMGSLSPESFARAVYAILGGRWPENAGDEEHVIGTIKIGKEEECAGDGEAA